MRAVARVDVFYRSGVAGDEAIQLTTSRRSAGSSIAAGKGQTKVTTMLLVVSFAWLILTTPFAVCGFIFAVGEVNRALADVLMPFKAAAFLLMYTNHAVNFYLYCMTGRRFRRELVDTLAACRCAAPGAGAGARRRQAWTYQQPSMTIGNGAGGGGVHAMTERGNLMTPTRLR